MSEPITLYSYRRCPFAIRVRMTLHEKGIPFETKEESLNNKSSELLSLHPQAKVPVLIYGKQVLYESSIITQFLDELQPEPALMPTTPAARAELRLFTFWCDQQFKPDVDRYKYGTSRFPAEQCEGAEQRVIGHLKRLEETLKQDTWLVGKTYSLADIHVFPFFRQLARITPAPEFLGAFPATTHWLETITARPAFEKTIAKQN